MNIDKILYWSDGIDHIDNCKAQLLFLVDHNRKYLTNSRLYCRIFYTKNVPENMKFWYFIYNYNYFPSLEEAKIDLQKYAENDEFVIVDQQQAEKFKLLI